MAWRAYTRRRCEFPDWLVPARLPGVEHNMMSRRTGCRSFPADGSPTPLGIHERPLQSLPVLHELEAIFLDSPVDFPSQIHVIAEHDDLYQTRGVRVLSSWRRKEQREFLFLMVSLMIMNHPLPCSAEAGLTPEHTYPVFPSTQPVPILVSSLKGLNLETSRLLRKRHEFYHRRVSLI